MQWCFLLQCVINVSELVQCKSAFTSKAIQLMESFNRLYLRFRGNKYHRLWSNSLTHHLCSLHLLIMLRDRYILLGVLVMITLNRPVKHAAVCKYQKLVVNWINTGPIYHIIYFLIPTSQFPTLVICPVLSPNVTVLNTDVVTSIHVTLCFCAAAFTYLNILGLMICISKTFSLNLDTSRVSEPK